MAETPRGFAPQTYSGPEDQYDADAARAAVAKAWARTHTVEDGGPDPADPERSPNSN